MKISVLVKGNLRQTVFSEKYFNRLAQLGELNIYDKDDFEDMDYVYEFLKGSNAIITSWASPAITKEVLDVCPDLKIVLHAAGSVKPVVTDEFVAKNIPITGSACAIGEGVAETALGFAISACKNFYQLSKRTKQGLWKENQEVLVKDFYDIKVGVISAGYVGRHMIKLLQNFHVDVLVYDPFITKEQALEIGATKVELDELMSQADVVSIHAPSIPATDNMINKDNLKLLKDGGIIINTARGSIINEQDLITELTKRRIYACIDVTNPEPPAANNELRFLDNVVLTPHIAGTSTNGLRRIALHVCEELERFTKGEKLKAEVNLANLSNIA